MICPSCDEENEAAARFCDRCGNALPHAEAAPPSSQRQPTLATVLTVGREPTNDIVLDYPMVSGFHARISITGSEARIEDVGSTNGTGIGSPEKRITSAALSSKDTVYFGSLPVPASRLLGGALSLGKEAHTTLRLSGEALVLGRDPTSTVVLDYPMISWRHARIVRTEGRVLLEDLGSTNGTFLNGRRIAGSAPAEVGDIIGLGSYTFRLAAADRLEQRDYRGNVTIEARGLTVAVPGARLLDGVSLTLYPSELTGLMGPSGAGKTTLMNALNGYARPTAGQVLFNGLDLYSHHAQFRLHIGYVPQDDIMHRDLTVREALYYTARLRLPKDYNDAEIARRIDLVLDQVELKSVGDVLVGSPERKGISGGQRKRVNLAMELLTDPFVLFLDEPTSGLSSEDALTVMRLLRGLADQGKSILITIHQPSLDIYRLMDSLVLVAKDVDAPPPGRVAYFGPAYPDAVRFFNPGLGGREPSPDLLLRGLKARPTADWVQLYEASIYKRQYVDDRATRQPRNAAPAAAGTPGSEARPKVSGSQWRTLTRRAFRLKLRDRSNTAILLAQAPLIALLIALVFAPAIHDSKFATTVPTVLFLLVVSALWFGCSNSAREIVGEWAIYRRERMVNLRIPSYITAKLFVLCGLAVVQCLLLMGIVYPLCELRGPFAGMLAVLFASAFVGVSIGLLLSAAARTSEAAISLVPLVLLPMIILGGMMHPGPEMKGPAQWLHHLMPSRWAFEGLLAAESPHWPATTAGTAMLDPFFTHSGDGAVGVALLVAMVMFALLLLGITRLLKSRDLH